MHFVLAYSGKETYQIHFLLLNHQQCAEMNFTRPQKFIFMLLDLWSELICLANLCFKFVKWIFVGFGCFLERKKERLLCLFSF